jgi:hypothetical protein
MTATAQPSRSRKLASLADRWERERQKRAETPRADECADDEARRALERLHSEPDDDQPWGSA